jgi:hypothetical protein
MRTAALAAQRRAQLAVALNLSLVAVCLPIGWNWVVRRKHAAAALAAASLSSHRPTLADAARAEQEQLAVQLLVDERRRARGLPAYYAPRLPGEA